MPLISNKPLHFLIHHPGNQLLVLSPPCRCDTALVPAQGCPPIPALSISQFPGHPWQNLWLNTPWCFHPMDSYQHFGSSPHSPPRLQAQTPHTSFNLSRANQEREELLLLESIQGQLSNTSLPAVTLCMSQPSQLGLGQGFCCFGLLHVQFLSPVGLAELLPHRIFSDWHQILPHRRKCSQSCYWQGCKGRLKTWEPIKWSRIS